MTALSRFYVFIEGNPAPKGMLARSPHGGLYWGMSKKAKEWLRRLKQELNSSTEVPFFAACEECGVNLNLEFFMPVPRRVVLENEYARGPDIDKLTRMVMDALEGIIYDDDKRVVGLTAKRTWAEGSRSGVSIRAFRTEGSPEYCSFCEY